MLTHQCLKIFLLALIHNPRANLAAALQDGRDDSLTFSTSTALDLSGLHIAVHIAGLTADESLVYFYFTRELTARVLVLHCEPRTLQHEPRGFLRYTHRSVNLPRANAILAVDDQPHDGQPLFKTDW